MRSFKGSLVLAGLRCNLSVIGSIIPWVPIWGDLLLDDTDHCA